MFVGLILFVIGVAFLLKNIGLLDEVTWSVIWPILLIILALLMIFRRKKIWE